jgi:hypothetical protein
MTNILIFVYFTNIFFPDWQFSTFLLSYCMVSRAAGGGISSPAADAAPAAAPHPCWAGEA